MDKKGLNTKILKRITSKVQFRIKITENGKTEYLVERKSDETGEWEVVAKTMKLEKALMKKHNAWLAQLSRMNYTARLLRRRKQGKHKFLGLQVN